MRLFGLPSFISPAADGLEREREEKRKIKSPLRTGSSHAIWVRAREECRVEERGKKNKKNKKGLEGGKANERQLQWTLRESYKVNKRLSGETRLHLDVQLPLLSPSMKDAFISIPHYKPQIYFNNTGALFRACKLQHQTVSVAFQRHPKECLMVF